jgi:hypothetical protein
MYGLAPTRANPKQNFLGTEIADDIASQIRVQLTPEKQTQPANPRPVNLKALEAYLQGNYRLNEEIRRPNVFSFDSE